MLFQIHAVVKVDNSPGELVAHPDFVKLLADIQIYVEGIAAMQIQNLNAWVDVARAEIVEKYQPGENDGTTYLLQSAHVDEGECFTSRVHRDIDTPSWRICGRLIEAGATVRQKTPQQKN